MTTKGYLRALKKLGKSLNKRWGRLRVSYMIAIES
jgi:hypothetical protein